MSQKVEAYCLYSKEKRSLVFYYGEKPNFGVSLHDYLKIYKQGIAQDCENVYFDKSFKKYKPESCSSWFEGFVYLTKVFGLENLNIEDCRDFSCMFNNCISIIALDLSKLCPHGSIKVDDIFNGCDNLSCVKGMKEFFGVDAKVPSSCRVNRYLGKHEAIERARAATS